MNLARAQACADKLTEWLLPVCERIVVAGSIRRQKPECSDIDLVVIPKMVEERDLYGEVVSRRNTTWSEIDRRSTAEKWRVERAGSEIVTFHNKGVQVDVFWTTEALWGTTLLCRTGSKEHNIWLCNYAQSRGGKWNPTVGLYLNSQRFSHTEESIYGALGLDPIEPTKREAHLLPFAGLIRPPVRP